MVYRKSGRSDNYVVSVALREERSERSVDESRDESRFLARTAFSLWECYKKANEIYEAHGFGDHLVLNFHREGHAVLAEDVERIVAYFNHMYYGMDTGVSIEELKTTVFAGQE